MKSLISKIYNFIKNKFLVKIDKKHGITFVSIFVSVFIVLAAATLCAATHPNYVYIETEEDLELIRNDLDGDFIFLKQNIEITSKWTPIGSLEEPFTGTIDAKGCTISFIESETTPLTSNETSYFGFFGKNSGTIKNLNFYMHSLTVESVGSNLVFGNICAFNDGSISKCNVIQASNSIKLYSDFNVTAGGICGIGSHNFISNSSSTRFDIYSAKTVIAGGIIGELNKDLNMVECKSTASIFVQYSDNLLGGGLVASVSGSETVNIQNSYVRSSFEGFAANYSVFSGVIGSSISADISLKNIYSNCVFTFREAQNYSNFVGGGTFKISNCVSNPVFNYIHANSNYGSFCFKSYYGILIENSFYTNLYDNSFEEYGEYKPLQDISLKLLKWDNKIWRKDENGHFYLI